MLAPSVGVDRISIEPIGTVALFSFGDVGPNVKDAISAVGLVG